VTIGQVAEGEGITLEYAAKIMHTLKKAGLITSFRGVKGGFVLSKPASAITLWEVMQKLSGESYDEHFCEKFSGKEEVCVHVQGCSVRSVWSSVMTHLGAVLSKVSLSELLRDERHASYCLVSHFQQGAKPALAPMVFLGGKPS